MPIVKEMHFRLWPSCRTKEWR